MKWVVRRSLPVRTFIIVCRAVSSAERATYLKQHGQYITSIHFEGDDVGSETWKAQAVRDVCAFCPNVTHIEAPSIISIPAFKRIAQALPALSSVCFKPDACSNAAFTAMVEGCPQFTSIEVAYPGKQPCTWSRMVSLVPPNLLHIKLGTTLLTLGMIDALTTRCPLLRTLKVARGYSYVYSDEMLQRIATRCPFLEAIRISDGDRLHGAGIRALGQAG
jgi:hypothetical protein